MTSHPVEALVRLYIPLIGWIAFGWIIGHFLPVKVMASLGRFLFWIGVPISIVAFLYRADLSGWIVVAPITAWVAIAVGAVFARIWIELGLGDERIRALSRGLDGKATATVSLPETEWSKPTQGSFLLAMMIGNTGYMGYPVVLALVGSEYIAWALFYDLLGTFLAIYGVGVVIAARLGTAGTSRKSQLLEKMLKNPALWSIGIGLLLRLIHLPEMVEQSLHTCAWTIVNLSLVFIGLQLSRLTSLSKFKQVVPCIAIKMLIVPLVVGTGLMFFGLTAEPRLALVLQMGMPPAFSSIVFAEIYGLDRELAVTNIAFGCVSLLFLLPIWLFLFGNVQ